MLSHSGAKFEYQNNILSQETLLSGVHVISVVLYYALRVSVTSTIWHPTRMDNTAMGTERGYKTHSSHMIDCGINVDEGDIKRVNGSDL